MGASVGVLTYTPIFAHLGHWYVSLPVFGGPVVVIAIAVKVAERRERRRAREGKTSHARVAVAEGDDQTVLRVNGALDQSALLTIESEIDAAVARARQVLLDLRNVTSLEVDFAWDLIEIIKAVDGADVVVSTGPAPAMEPLRKMCAVEGVKLLDEETVRSGSSSS